MRRREFIGIIGGTAVWPLAARAQQIKKWRVSHVLPAVPSVMGPLALVFEQRLAQLGHVSGPNLVIDRRFAAPANLEQVLADLLPTTDLLVIWTTFGATLAKKLTSTIPVVFLGVGAPVDIGLVKSLSDPGGNMTGVTFEAATETYGKRLQILTEMMPRLERVGVLRTIGDPNVRFGMASLEKAAPQFGVTLYPIDIRSADELGEAFDSMTNKKVQALVVISSAVVYGASKRIGELTLAHQLPSCHPFRETVVAGGLVSLGPDTAVMAKQGADYVHKIMEGAKPSDLPVEQPTRYEIHLNLKTAKTLGLTIPPALLGRADEVIE